MNNYVRLNLWCRLIPCLVTFLFLSAKSVSAQSTCSTAIAMGSSYQVQIDESSGDAWVTFTPTALLGGIGVSPEFASAATPTENHIDTIEVFTGSCTSLTLEYLYVRGSSATSVFPYAFAIGQQYFVRVSNSCNCNDLYVLSLVPFGPPECESNCNASCNGNFDSTANPLPIFEQWTNIENAGCWNTYYDPASTMWLDMYNYPPTGVLPQGSPDYFNCSASLPQNPWEHYMHIPNNWVGSQAAFSGCGYAGIRCFEVSQPYFGNPNSSSNYLGYYREYLQQQMCDSMIAGHKYRINFSASLADSSAFGTYLGVLFTGDTIVAPNPPSTFPAGFYGMPYNLHSPQFETPTKCINTTGWDSYSFVFTADSNYKHMSIGNFRNPSATNDTMVSNNTFLDWASQASASPIQAAYYYIDGVEVLPLDSVTDNGHIHYACSSNPVTLTCQLASPNTHDSVHWVASPVDPSLTAWLSSHPAPHNSVGVSPSVNTTYYVTIYDTLYHCVYYDTMLVILDHLNPAIVMPVGATTCTGCLNFTTTTPYSTYSWLSNATTSSCGSCSTFTVCFDSTFTQTSAPILLTVHDSIGCVAQATAYVPICCIYKLADSLNIVNDSSTHVPVSHPNVIYYNSANGTYDALNKSFSINGVFYVNANTRFIGCDVWMAQDAKIIVRPGCTLEFTRNGTSHHPTYVHGGCGVMWDGIYIDGTNPATELLVNDSTVIEDGKTAIVSTHGGKFTIDGSGGQVKLNKNYIAIRVHNYSGAHPGTIRKTIISCDAPTQPGGTAFVTSPGAFLQPPYAGTCGLAGIVIDTCTNITIGDSTINSYRNFFERTYFGIYSECSNTKVWNNDFRYITGSNIVNPNVPTGVAIYATNRTSGNVGNTLTVGRMGGRKAANHFSRCKIGVEADKGMNVSVERNMFDSCTKYCFYAFKDLNRQIKVNYDTLHDCTFINIGVVQSSHSIVTITNNAINQSANVVAANFGQTGIYVVNSGVANENVLIQNNAIEKMRNGIWVSKVNNAKILDNYPISFIANAPFSVAQPATGIHIDTGHGIKVRDNTVNYYGVLNGTDYDKLMGIYMENCTSDTVTQNSMTNLGSGIFLKGADNPSVLACNSLTNCIYGFNFGYSTAQTPVSLNSQILYGSALTITPTGNSWTGCTYDLKGQIVGGPINWYYNTPLPTFQMVPFSFVANTPTQTNNVDQCSNFLKPPTVTPAIMRESMLYGICVNPRKYDTLSDEFTYNDLVFAYRMLRDSSSWLSLGTDDDTYYQNFYSQYSNTNISVLADVEDAISNEDYATASNALASFTPINVQEQNKMDVLNVLLETWARDSINFSDDQISTLENVASQGSITGGNAVFDARNMLGMEVHDSTNLRLASANLQSSNTETSHIYPNPNSGVFSVKCSLGENQVAEMNVYDLEGRRLFASEFIGGQDVYTFDASYLLNGTYIYIITSEGEVLSNDRLIIIKQE